METGTIVLFDGTTEPTGWAFLNGQELDRVADAGLYGIYGDTYNKPSTPLDKFALPDRRGRFPLYASTTHPLNELGGVENVTLTIAQMPAHSHSLQASSATNGSVDSPIGGNIGAGQIDRSTGDPLDKSFIAPENAGTLGAMAGDSIGNAGEGEPHSNMPPYFTTNFIVKR